MQSSEAGSVTSAISHPSLQAVAGHHDRARVSDRQTRQGIGERASLCHSLSRHARPPGARAYAGRSELCEYRAAGFGKDDGGYEAGRAGGKSGTRQQAYSTETSTLLV